MIPAAAFLQQLNAGRVQLAPAYLVFGEEPLYLRRVKDALRAWLNNQGFIEREVYDVDKSFDWVELEANCNTGSLFAEQRIVELNMPTGNPGTAGTKFLQSWTTQPLSDVVLIVYCDRLDSRQQKSKWSQAIVANGVGVQTREMDERSLPGWVMQEAKALNINLNQEAAALLADRTQGNLLAAEQELIKLSLALGEGASINPEQIAEQVVDQAHYQIFALTSAMLLGQVGGSLSILQRLEQEGDEAVLVLWWLTREIRQLVDLAQMQGRLGLDSAMKKARIWSSKQREYRAALARQNIDFWQECLLDAYKVDRQIKGIESANPWLGMNRLVAKVARR